MPLISVIVPVYNVEKYLRQCMSSLVNQTLKDIEIICVNDGSTDNSLHILKEFSACDSRVKVISKSNTGYGDSMNIGISHAKGQYIGIVESDDYALPNMFESLYCIACEKGADVVKSNYFYVSEKGMQYNEALSDIPYEKIFSPLNEMQIFKVEPSIWSGLYKKSFLDKERILFNPSPGASFQDISFEFKVLLSTEKMVCIQDAYLCYRCNNENASVKSPKKIYCIMDEFRVIKDYIVSNKKESLLPLIEPEKFSHYMMTYFRIGSIYQYAFLEKMAIELQQDHRDGIIVKKYWPEENWSLMEKIRSDAETYFEENHIDYLNKYRYKDYIINNDLGDIGAQTLLKNAEKVIIYGAGIYGHRTLKSISRICKIYCFSVTKISDDTPDKIEGIPIYEIGDLQIFNKESVVIVAMKKSTQLPVLQNLKTLGFDKVISVDKAL